MLNRLQEVFRCFQQNDVRYIIIDGIASILYGVPRVTFDLDILIEAKPENAGRLLEALKQAGLGTAELTTAVELLKHEITVFEDRIRIDVMTAAPGIEFQKTWENRNTVKFHGQELHLLSKEDLIASKKASGRDQDIEDIRLLRMNENSTHK